MWCSVVEVQDREGSSDDVPDAPRVEAMHSTRVHSALRAPRSSGFSMCLHHNNTAVKGHPIKPDLLQMRKEDP